MSSPALFSKDYVWHWQDVYHETVDQTREEARLRILEPVCRLKSGPLLCAYWWCVAAVHCSDYWVESSTSWAGDDGDHIFYWRRSWAQSLSIVRYSICAGPEANTLVDLHGRRCPFLHHRVQAHSAGCQCFGSTLPCAPVCVVSLCTRMCCVELYPAAAKENMAIEFAGLRVYGLLTNAVTFAFYSYDPITRKFCFDESIIIANKRPSSLSEMVDGAYFFYHSHLELTSLLCSFR